MKPGPEKETDALAAASVFRLRAFRRNDQLSPGKVMNFIQFSTGSARGALSLHSTELTASTFNEH